MKNVFNSIPFLLLLYFIVGCSCKKEAASDVLPPITQEGKNTVGFKANSKVWTPYSNCGFSQNPCGAISMEYNLPTTPLYFSLQTTRNENSNSFSTFNISSITLISTIGNKYDSVDIMYTEYSRNPPNIIEYTKSHNPKGNFTITKIDSNNQIISGTFECTLYSATDSVVITEGRFDCKFYTCICNN